VAQRLSEANARVCELVMPEHTNQYGTVFGGYLVALMDKAAYMVASRYARSMCVTAGMDRLDFTRPIRVGQVVEVIARLTYVSRTAMEIAVEARGEDVLEGTSVEACSGYFTFVAVDQQGHPVEVPQPELESEEEITRFWEGQKRHQERARTRGLRRSSIDSGSN